MFPVLTCFVLQASILSTTLWTLSSLLEWTNKYHQETSFLVLSFFPPVVRQPVSRASFVPSRVRRPSCRRPCSAASAAETSPWCDACSPHPSPSVVSLWASRTVCRSAGCRLWSAQKWHPLSQKQMSMYTVMGAMRRCRAVEFDSCNNLWSHVHTALVLYCISTFI